MFEFKIKKIKYRNNLKKILQKDTYNLSLIVLIVSVFFFGFLLPMLAYPDVPFGTDVFTHLIYTKIMVKSDSLAGFYKYCIQHYYKEYGYPFGMWLFGALIAKTTGVGMLQLAMIIPLLTASIFLLLYYRFSKLFNNDIGYLSILMLLTTPSFCMSLLNYSTSIFTMFMVVFILYMLLDDDLGFPLRIATITLFLFVLIITHTGTTMFVMFLLTSFLIVHSIFEKRVHNLAFVTLAIQMFLMVVLLGKVFEHVHYQYLDKGRMIVSIGHMLSSVTFLNVFQSFSELLYRGIFLNLNPIIVILWLSLLYTIALGLARLSSRVGGVFPAIFGVSHISHEVAFWPIWLGPIHILLAIPGFFKSNSKGKILLIAVALVAVPSGLIAKERALRELHYFYIILPIISAIGFKYLYNVLKLKYDDWDSIKRGLTFLGTTCVLTSFVLIPIVGNLYYHPLISGPKYERDGMSWLRGVGSSNEGAVGLVGSRVAIYSDKVPIAVTSVSAGSEAKRFGRDLYNILFVPNSEKYAKDLYTAFGVKYYILTSKIKRVYSLPLKDVIIDDNSQFDKIYSSKSMFGIYSEISYPTKRERISSRIDFSDVPTILDAGTGYLVETPFYKIRIGKENPGIDYLGNKTSNYLGGGELFDIVSISDPKENVTNAWLLADQPYSTVTLGKNKILYETTLRYRGDPVATLIVKYTFYNESFRRDIYLWSDWLNDSVDSAYQMQLFTPIRDFYLYMNDEMIKSRIVYPSEDLVVMKDLKYNEISFGKKIFVYYEDSAPYPDEITYKGSTTYLYKYYSIATKLKKYLAPGECLHVTQLISLDEFPKRYVVEVSPYEFGKVPVILVCEDGRLNVTSVNSSNVILKYKLYELPKLKGYIIAKKIRLPYYIYNKEGYRRVQNLYYHGQGLDLYLIPISKPILSENTKDWEKPIDVLKTAESYGDVVVFLIKLKGINRTGLDKLLNYIKGDGDLVLTTPEKLLRYTKLIKNVDIYVTNLNGEKRITIVNNNRVPIRGLTIMTFGKYVEGGKIVKRFGDGRLEFSVNVSGISTVRVFS